MIKDRSELELYVKERLEEIKPSRKKKNIVNKYLLEFGVPLGVFEDISKGDHTLDTISDPLLCLLTDAIYELTGYTEMSPKNWFTEHEINMFKETIRFAYEDQARMTLPITLEEVIALSEDSFITKIKMSTLVRMFHSQLIKYKFETQRSAKFMMKRDGAVPVPDLNLKSVEDIATNMINETYLEDMITLNVYSDESEALLYNLKNKTLEIRKNAAISILDGFHRLQGGIRAMTINSELKQTMILSIRSYDTPTAQKYFGQINTINPVKVERRKELLSNKNSDLVIKNLQLKSDLKGKVASSSSVSKIAKQLTTFDIMSYAVDKVFMPKSKMEATELSEYLITFYNYLVGSFTDEFLNNPQNYEDTNINHPLMFIGYTVIAKYFKDNEIHPRNIRDFVEKFDFNEEHLIEIFEKVKFKGINSKQIRKSILTYFQNQLRGA